MRIAVSFCLLLLAASPSFGDEKSEFFESRVRPILAKHCFKCHNRAAKSNLRLDSRKRMLSGGRRGAAIVPGHPKKSLLIQAVSGTHEKLKMPPGNPLPPEDIAALAKWIRDGATWPKSAPGILRDEEESGITAADRAFWSFQPIKKPSIPKVAESAWSANPIDAFIADKHWKLKLVSAPIADHRTLIRRITYDLTGLPPDPDRVDQFMSDAGKEFNPAYRALIERLLDSRHYGERWAQHWLDLVRYADTAGDAADFPIPEAYKYRNYVIDAFNADLPFDEFIREQLAGDLLPFENDDDRWRKTIATGYIAISRRIGVSPHGLRHITIEDTLNNLGKTFLGLTIGCSRCHDHKFDPIPTSDYYALYGIFDSTVYPHAGAEHRPYRSDFVYRIGKSGADKILTPLRVVVAEWDKKERAAFERYRDYQRKPASELSGNRETAWQEVLRLRAERAKAVKRFPDLEIAYAASEATPHDVEIQEQGNPQSKGERVRRGFLQILGGASLPDDIEQSGRLHLANWIADEKNPLTARVMVNRIWQHHFGQGLVTTPSDFGVRGAKPSHPELLDFLSAYFVENGWSIKKLHRLIVTSRTYRLSAADVAASSAIDPTNRFLWRANRRRLDAEQIRDSILTFSGQLVRSPGGRHPFPHRLTYFFRQHEPFVGDYETNRRSIYMMRQRIRKNRFLDMFDGPDGNLHFGSRRTTTTTLQALYFMNSEFAHQQSVAIASRLMNHSSALQDRVTWAYQTIFGRTPNDDEITAARKYLQTAASQVADDKQLAACSGYIRGMISSNEFLFLE